MDNDLKLIKLRIYEENRIEELLEHMECQYIRQVSNRYEAQLPEKFNSNNRRSVQIYISESLPCRVRSRSVSGIDIFGLVSYIVFDADDDDEIKRTLYKSKRWICERLGYNEYINGSYIPQEEKEDPLLWLKKLKKQRKRELREIEENPVYDDTILNQYIMLPHIKYLEEGISYDTQKEFEIGYDVNSNRIIFPIRNQYGDIVSVKGRTLYEDYEVKDIPKYRYFINFNKQLEWYNLHLALWYALEEKYIIIFEAEKSCWLSSQWGYRNCIAIGGSDISSYQVELLKRLLPIDTKIILALDKDKEKEDIIKEAKKFKKHQQLYVMWDKRNLLSKEKKQAPVDAGKDVFEFLLKDSKHRRLIV